MTVFKLSNEILKNPSLSNEGFVVYVGLRGAFREYSSPILVGPSLLSYVLLGNPHYSARQMQSYNAGLDELYDLELIEIIHENRHCKIIDLSKIRIADQHQFFSLIAEDEVKTILNYSNTKNDILLLRLFCVLLSTMHKDKTYGTYVGKTTQDYQMHLTGISHNTYRKYYSILEKELELIHTYHPDTFWYDENFHIDSGISNTYGRKKDAEAINKIGAADLQSSKQNNKKAKKLTKTANPRRAAAQVYFHWIGGTEYSYEQLKEAYSNLLEMNKNNNNNYDKKNRVRDLSAFKKYDFYKGEGTI